MKKALRMAALAGIILLLLAGCNDAAKLEKAYTEGNYQAVLKMAEELAKLQPHNPDFYYFMGQAHGMNKNWPEAIKAYEHVLTLDPHYTNPPQGDKNVSELLQEAREELNREKEESQRARYEKNLQKIKEMPLEKERARELKEAYEAALDYNPELKLLVAGVAGLAGLGETSLAYDLYERFELKVKDLEMFLPPSEKEYFARTRLWTPHLATAKAGSIPQAAGGGGRISLVWLADGSGFVYAVDENTIDEDNIRISHWDLESGTSKEIYGGSWFEEGMEVKRLLDGRIVYQDNRKILFIDPQAAGVVKEISLPLQVKWADVSLDGTRVAYTTLGEEGGLWVSDIDLETASRVLANSGEDIHMKVPGSPRWSPDGTWLAYIDSRWEGTAGVGVVNADGSGHRYVQELAGAYYPRWFPDGKTVALSIVLEGESPSVAWVLDIDSRGLEKINAGRDANYPLISPQGDKISYLRYCGIGYDLWIEDRESKRQYLVGGNIGVVAKEWSPEGRRLVFAVNPSTGNSLDFWLCDLAGEEEIE